MSAQRQQQNPRRDLAVVPITEASEVDVAKVNELSPRLMAQFPNDCNPQQALEVARLAVAYGLDPFLKELIPYQGAPYITMAGMIRIAERHPAFDGFEDDIVFGDRLKALQTTPNEIIWECTVYRKDRRRPVRAYGRAGGAYDDRQAVAKARPFEMAQKRAIHRALRAAFPVPIPGLEMNLTPEQLRAIHALDDEHGVDRDQRHETLIDTFGVESSKDLTRDQASAYIDGRQVQITEVVDSETGEILSGPPAIPQERFNYLFAIAGQRGWDADAVKALAYGLFGIETLKDLTRPQFSQLLEHIQSGMQRTSVEPTASELDELDELDSLPPLADDEYWAANGSLVRWRPFGDPQDDINAIRAAADRATTPAQITELWTFTKQLGLDGDDDLKGFLAARRRDLTPDE